MALIDRYIAIIWLRLLALCLGGFVALYLVIDLIEKVPRFMRAGGAAGDMLEYFICKFPEMIGRTTTFSVLMATLLTLGVLAKDSELTALRSCGISLVRISMPMLFLGFCVSIFLLVNAEFILPRSYAHTEYLDRVKIKKKGENVTFKRNNIWFRSGNQIIQARLFEPKSKTLHGVVLWQVDSQLTPSGRIDAELATCAEHGWQLHNAVEQKFSASGFEASPPRTMTVPLDLKIEDLRVLDSDADNMSIRTLKEYADSLERGGYQAYRYLTLMHTKIAAPFAALIMVLLGIPFALRSNRSSGMAMGVGISIGIGFIYFIVNALLLSYGRSGVLPPVIAAWSANLLFAVLGMWLAMTVKR